MNNLKKPKPIKVSEVAQLYVEDLMERFSPLFDAFEDNHEVLRAIEKAGVVNEECDADSEMGEVFIEFKSKSAVKRFVDRLNTYVEARWQMMNAAWLSWEASRQVWEVTRRS